MRVFCIYIYMYVYLRVHMYMNIWFYKRQSIIPYMHVNSRSDNRVTHRIFVTRFSPLLLTHIEAETKWQPFRRRCFSWMKISELRVKLQWSLFLRVQLTIFQHWIIEIGLVTSRGISWQIMVSLPTHICVTRHQLVQPILIIKKGDTVFVMRGCDLPRAASVEKYEINIYQMQYDLYECVT